MNILAIFSSCDPGKLQTKISIKDDFTLLFTSQVNNTW